MNAKKIAKLFVLITILVLLTACKTIDRKVIDGKVIDHKHYDAYSRHYPVMRCNPNNFCTTTIKTKHIPESWSLIVRNCNKKTEACEDIEIAVTHDEYLRYEIGTNYSNK